MVYVTVTAEPGTRLTREAGGDSILLATGSTPPIGGTTTEESDSPEHVTVEGHPEQIPQRAIVLVFNSKDWNVQQTVYVGAMNTVLPKKRANTRSPAPLLSHDSFYDNAVVRNVEVTKIGSGSPAIRTTDIGNSNTPGLYGDGASKGGAIFSSATATFVTADIGQPIIQIAGSNIPAGTTIKALLSETEVELSNVVSSASGIEFALPSRITPPAHFTDGAGNGSRTFTSSSADFTISDLGQELLETDGGGHIPSGDVIVAVISNTTVELAAAVSSASHIAFVLPSRLDGLASFRDGASKAGSATFTSATAAFNEGDIGRPIVETDSGSALASGTVILEVKSPTEVVLSAKALATASGISFALPARNASDVVLEGKTAKEAIVDYYSIELATEPAGEVIVEVDPAKWTSASRAPTNASNRSPHRTAKPRAPIGSPSTLPTGTCRSS